MSLFDVPQDVLNARPQGAKDFDFLQGRWLIHHKRLAERLVGCQTWQEFETPAANQLILGGLGNIDHCRIESPDFLKAFLFACLIRVPVFGAFIGWIQTAQLSFRHLKVLSLAQSDCFADTISITVFRFW